MVHVSAGRIGNRAVAVPTALYATLLATLVAACSDPPAPTPGAVADAVVDVPDTEPDTLFGGFDAPLPSGDADAADVPPAVTPTCEFAPDPGPGEPGASCAQASDCNSGVCIDDADGKICTTLCVECCPGGFRCGQVGEGDTIFACIPSFVRLCRPCVSDAECTIIGDDALCLDYGATGRFCGGTCKVDSDCPPAFACELASGTQGTSKQCVRKTGECTCSAKSIAQGAATSCTVANEAGICKGTRKCTPDGLSACDAPSPLTETCNDVDDDCDGQTDEPGTAGCKVFYPDVDGDGFGQQEALGGVPQCLCQAKGDYTTQDATDCADDDKAVHPDATEVCNDLDDDCQNGVDDGCDDDQDGFCDAKVLVVGGPKVCGNGAGDCDDGAAGVYPTAKEQCGNQIDDDCNAKTDEEEDAAGCTAFYRDMDKDGIGTFDSKCLCGPAGDFTASQSGDCNDSDGDVMPGKAEVCNNGKDDNCNGQQDEPDATGCEAFFVDGDSDGYGTGQGICQCGPTVTHTVKKGGDCDDAEPKKNPAIVEACNGVDDDCDGAADEKDALGCGNFYADADKDGFGDPKAVACLCQPDATYFALAAGDCDDQQAKANPAQKETCDAIDNDCDSEADEQDALGCAPFWVDSDGDGYGDVQSKACLCKLAAPWNVATGGDCDDKQATVNPKAAEACNGFDDDCDGQTDDESAKGCKMYLYDDDGDGFGQDGASKCLCVATKPFSATKGADCNDFDPAIKPGAQELCDSVDNDCNGTLDDANAKGCIEWFADGDKDGFGSTLLPPQCTCVAKPPYSAKVPGDCNDGDGKTYPGAPEFCDGSDTDCDGTKDPIGAGGCTTYFADGDGDGYGVASNSQCACGPSGLHTAKDAGDCNDKSLAINPGMTELCNGVDDNCNGTIDADSPAAKKYYTDADKDGYGTGSGQLLCTPSGNQTTLVAGDCNDGNGAVHPTAKEVCNGVDDNCAGGIDEGPATSLCAPVPFGAPVCASGTCKTSCSGVWFDIDGNYGTGCECQADANYGVSGGSCQGAIDLGSIADNGTKVLRNGNIMPGESDWYRFKAVDQADGSGGCDKFSPRARFTNNPDGNFVLDWYRGGCAGANQLCSLQTDSSWTTAFYGGVPSGPGAGTGGSAGDVVKSPVPENAGECKCAPSPGLPGMNVCADNSADFFVRVFRKSGAGNTCAAYTVEFSNGL